MKDILNVFIVSALCLFFVITANAWTLHTDYDEQSVGDVCNYWLSTQAVVASIQANTGANSCKTFITGGSTGFGEWGGIINFPSKLRKGDEIWIRIRTYWPAGFDYDSTGEGNHLKFIRVHTRDSAVSNYGYNDWYISPSTSSGLAHEFIYEGNVKGLWDMVRDISYKPNHDIWETYEYYIKFDNIPADEGGVARIKAWKNGTLIMNSGINPTLKTKDTYADRMHIFTYWNGAAPKTQEMYIDDFFVTTAEPSHTDADGNNYIGVATTYNALPKPPSSVQKE